MNSPERKVVVLLPCYNEEMTIAKVIQDFRSELPNADIWVYDNNSTDNSVKLASEAGANIRRISQQGKGHVIRRMFREIDADCYVLVDSDDTYPASKVKNLMAPIDSGEADMVTGDRLSLTYHSENKRQFHSFGNTLVCWLIKVLFSKKIFDVMTGYRAFSKAFVKSCPVLSSGFEVETELTLHALDKRMNIVEIPIKYRDRPEGSVSKLNTFSDGFRVLKTIFYLFKDYRPLLFFSLVGGILILLATLLFVPVLLEYIQTGLVPRFPSLIASVCLVISGLLSCACGLILESNKKYTDQLFEILVLNQHVNL